MFANKIAIITGSTMGIGLATARRLGREGASVVVSSRKKENVDEAVKDLKNEGIDVHGVVCHIGDQQQRDNLLKETLAKYGGVDIFVANASVSPYMGKVLDTPESVWDKVYDLNVKSTFLQCRDIVPHMAKRVGGSIVIVGSIVGYFTLHPRTSWTISAYAISKLAQAGLVKALYPELTEMNIRINGIAAGAINTRFFKPLVENEAVYEYTVNGIPMKRFGEPEECAGVIAFLCSKDASYIQGEMIPVSGGVAPRH